MSYPSSSESVGMEGRGYADDDAASSSSVNSFMWDSGDERSLSCWPVGFSWWRQSAMRTTLIWLFAKWPSGRATTKKGTPQTSSTSTLLSLSNRSSSRTQCCSHPTTSEWLGVYASVLHRLHRSHTYPHSCIISLLLPRHVTPQQALGFPDLNKRTITFYVVQYVLQRVQGESPQGCHPRGRSFALLPFGRST